MNNYKALFSAILFFTLLPLSIFAQGDAAPVLTASGDQIYCPGSPMNIATDFNITGTTGINAIYVQISSGYVNGQDVLSLSGSHPGITTSWNVGAGKLTLSGTGGQDISYPDLIAAIEDVLYTNTNSTNPAPGTRTFSITIGQANYLPSTGHYYQYISQIGISWTSAKAAAEASTYYGLQGYLATLLSAEEAQLCGEQATGTGWIGGSDAQTEGVWKWVTGPEAGTVFWNGGTNGSTPNFAFWNNGEPNNQNDEDYAHITAPGVGIPGSWNDLPNSGSTGDYEPKGYIVEYGGMPGDPVLHISASTTITIAVIDSSTPASACGQGPVTLEATTTGTNVYWYADATGGTPLATGTTFTTPAITATTTYYASSLDETCSTATRTAVVATINPLPTATVTNNQVTICGPGTANLQATASDGTINWYDAAAGGNLIGSGNSITSPSVNSDTTFYAEAVSTAGCIAASRKSVTVTVNPVPVVTSAADPAPLCGEGSATLQATPSAGTINWYDAATAGNLVGTGNSIASPVVNATTVFYAEAEDNTCISASRTPVTVTVNPLPVITAPQTDYYICEEGPATLEATASDGTINWYDAATGGNLLATGNSYTTPYLTSDTVFYAEAESSNGCVSADRTAFNAIITPLPTVDATEPASACQGSLATLTATPSDGTINWYTEPTGGTSIGTGDSITVGPVAEDTVYYAEAENHGCVSATREAVTVTVFALPVVDGDEDITFCEGSQQLLDAGVDNVTYHWSTGATTKTITVLVGGTYTVDVTNAAGCSATRTFVTQTIDGPEITNVQQDSDTATIIVADPAGSYEYSLDGINYQQSPVFNNIINGPHTAYVRSLDGCGIDTYDFTVFLVPKFFTPNNDSANDVFMLSGLSYYPDARVTIFDRYGKIISQLSNTHAYWDGTYNGHKMPADDYWYTIKLDKSSPEIKGHFSLIR